jgi:phosphoenolpyruvate carboxylase
VEIMTEYAGLVEDCGVRERILGKILEEYRRTEHVLDRLYPRERGARRPRLVKAIDMRRNALIRLHREQIALLREWREAGRAESPGRADGILRALLATVNAIAGGLKTTG